MQSASRPVRVPLPRRWPVRASDIVALLAANGALILAMWVRHGGADHLTSPGAILTAAGQVTALLGTYLALIQLVLMSRSPWLDQVFFSMFTSSGRSEGSFWCNIRTRPPV